MEINGTWDVSQKCSTLEASARGVCKIMPGFKRKIEKKRHFQLEKSVCLANQGPLGFVGKVSRQIIERATG